MLLIIVIIIIIIIIIVVVVVVVVVEVVVVVVVVAVVVAVVSLAAKDIPYRILAIMLREYLIKGYGLWFSMEIYGSKRERTDFHEYPQEFCFVLTEVSTKLRKPPGVYGIM